MEYKAVVKRRSDDELQHHKYIKRVKGKNGKWRYYYDIKDAMGVDEREARDLAVAKQKKAVATEQKMAKELSTVDEFAKKANVDRTVAREAAVTDYNDARNARRSADVRAMKAINDYSKTPLGKIERVTEAVNKGSRYLKDLLKRRR